MSDATQGKGPLELSQDDVGRLTAGERPAMRSLKSRLQAESPSGVAAEGKRRGAGKQSPAAASLAEIRAMAKGRGRLAKEFEKRLDPKETKSRRRPVTAKDSPQEQPP